MKGNYYKTEESVNEYIELAKDVDGREIINKLTPFLEDNMSILEIGSGPGKDYSILNESYNVTGSDSSKEFIRVLQESYPTGKFLELDAATLITDEKFDAIYSNKVIQHLTNDELEESIKRQFEMLNSGGIVCHTCWKGEGVEEFKGMFVNYFLEEDITNMFNKYFEIITLECYNEFEDGDSILVIAKKR